MHLPPAMRRAAGLPILTAVALDVPDKDITDVTPGPDDRAMGDDWAQNGSLALRVPSRVIRHDLNLLINPRHDRIKMVTVALSETFEFDVRLQPWRVSAFDGISI